MAIERESDNQRALVTQLERLFAELRQRAATSWPAPSSYFDIDVRGYGARYVVLDDTAIAWRAPGDKWRVDEPQAFLDAVLRLANNSLTRMRATRASSEQ